MFTIRKLSRIISKYAAKAFNKIWHPPVYEYYELPIFLLGYKSFSN